MNHKDIYKFFVLFILLSCSTHQLTRDMKPEVKVQFVLDEMINDSDTPGVQYIILNSNKILFEYYNGLAKLDNRSDLSVETTFNTFSVTKTFTALAILQLEEQGKPQQLVFEFSKDEQNQIRLDLESLRMRLERIPEEKVSEADAIEKRYSGLVDRTFPVAVEFLVPKSMLGGA